MKNIKRVLSVVLSVLMLVSMMAMSQISFTFAATENGYTYVITADNTATITGYTGGGTRLELPEKLGGVNVGAIGEGAFMDNRTLSSVKLSKYVTAIGDSAFAGCAAMVEFVANDELLSVGDGAFLNCASLAELKLGNKATTLGIGMLSGCTALSALTVPELNAPVAVLFNGAAAADAGFPATLKTVTVTKDDTVEAGAFKGMTKVTKIEWLTAPTAIGASAFEGCSALSELTLSTSKVVEIENSAFKNCKNLTSFALAAKVESIGASAFEGCSALATVTASGKLYEVGADALKGTAWLAAQPAGAVLLSKVFVTFKGEEKVITVPAEAEFIADGALKGNAAVKEVIIPDNVSYIGKNVLTDTAVEKVTIPYVGPAEDSIDSLVISYLFGGESTANNAFALPESLKEVTITSCKLIPNQSFEGAAYITTVSIPSSVTAIGGAAFKNCAALEVVNYDAANATVAADAFAGSPVAEVNFGENVKTIPTYLCTSNDNLYSVTVPAAVTKIDARAFAGCYNVTTVYYNAVNCNAIAADAFDYCHKLNEVVLGETVRHIPANLYSRYGGSAIKALTVPEEITSIAEGAFSNCTALETLYFNAAACEIGDDAFTGCKKLTNIVLGKKVTTIPSNLYAGNTAIEKITIPATVDRIDDYAFSGCSALTEIIVPDSLTDVGLNVTNGSKWYELQGDGALYLGKIYVGYKGSLPADNTITIADGSLAIADGSFKGNGTLKDVFIPNSVSYIGVDAFKDTAASITCYQGAAYVIDYADQNGIVCNILPCFDDDVYYEIVTEATAESAGVWNKWCYECHQILATEEYAKGDETTVWVMTKAPDCTEMGEITLGTDTRVLGARGHGKSIWKETKAATCAAEGISSEFCADCGEKLGGTKVRAKPEHVAGGWTVIKQPRTYCEGINAVLCTGCGEVLKSKKLDKLAEDDTVGVLYGDLFSSEWYYPTVQFVLNNGLMNGMSEDTFDPHGTMTRAMFVTVIGRMAGVQVDHSVKTQFTDVKKNQYYTGYVAWAVDNGIVNGVTNKSFAPNDPITREQICTMIVRYADYAQIKLTAKKNPEIFRDADTISKYAVNAVLTCQQAGIVKGRGNRYFAPKAKATRAEVAQVLKNLALGFLAD